MILDSKFAIKTQIILWIQVAVFLKETDRRRAKKRLLWIYVIILSTCCQIYLLEKAFDKVNLL